MGAPTEPMMGSFQGRPFAYQNGYIAGPPWRPDAAYTQTYLAIWSTEQVPTTTKFSFLINLIL